MRRLYRGVFISEFLFEASASISRPCFLLRLSICMFSVLIALTSAVAAREDGAQDTAGAAGANLAVRAELFNAIENGDLEEVRLLAKRVDLRRVSTDLVGTPPLVYAVEKNRDDIVKFLLEFGVDPNAREELTGRTALAVAVEKGNVTLFKRLLEAGADTNYRERGTGRTLFHLAVRSGSSNLVMELVRRGFRSDIPDSSGITARALGESSPNYVIRDQVRRADPKWVRKKRMHKALLLAIRKRETQRAIKLLDEGADPMAFDEFGRPPIFFAAKMHDLRVIDHLLKKGVGIDSPSRWGQTVLMWAVANRDSWLVRMLLKRGADVNKVMPDSKAAVHFAAENGDAPLLELLLDHGADKNALWQSKAFRNWTPLMIAAARGYRKCVAVLLRRGARLDVRSSLGATALKLARLNKHKAIVEMLRRVGAPE
ncbi:MAG: ankyrin repeat domain-containing protein [Candidatus Hydrogenedentota bacterium]|nr:MAG: ankyrin repeat domain-containing protein [Candidatus Hydrogenedentota bacterium]